MVINKDLLKPLQVKSLTNPRRRINYNFHTEASDTLQRMLNVIQPGSYCQPHKHESPDKREVFIILTGKLLLVLFDDQGKIEEWVVLDRDAGVYGFEVAPRRYHSIIALEADTVVYELKDGPYNPADDKHFACWAPSEGEGKACDEYIRKLLSICAVSHEE